MSNDNDQHNDRKATALSAAVDAAIIKYEDGDWENALMELRNLGFRASDIHRLIKYPDQRRTYINDMVSGF